jgi:ceramide glucosyltransferase
VIALALIRLIFALVTCLGICYCAVSVFGMLRFWFRAVHLPLSYPAITILKPIRGLETELYENLRTFCDQEYPYYEVIFGVRDPGDPAIGEIERVIAAFPDRNLRLVVSAQPHSGNPKVANLANMLPHANGEIIVIADADMRVDRRYLGSIAADFDDQRIGAATCLYAGDPRGGLASQLAVMQLNDQFAPSVLVATLFGDPKFCFGSTMAVRRAVLEEIGGLEALAVTIADDYMLGALVTKAGHRVRLSRYIVRDIVSEPSVGAMLRHELRWARTIRAILPFGYVSTIVTFPLPFALLTVLLEPAQPSAWIAFGIALLVRWNMHALMAVLFGLRGQEKNLWLIPLRDCFGLAVWAAGLFGTKVRWKEQTLDTRGLL